MCAPGVGAWKTIGDRGFIVWDSIVRGVESGDQLRESASTLNPGFRVQGLG